MSDKPKASILSTPKGQDWTKLFAAAVDRARTQPLAMPQPPGSDVYVGGDHARPGSDGTLVATVDQDGVITMLPSQVRIPIKPKLDSSWLSTPGAPKYSLPSYDVVTVDRRIVEAFGLSPVQQMAQTLATAKAAEEYFQRLLERRQAAMEAQLLGMLTRTAIARPTSWRDLYTADWADQYPADAAMLPPDAAEKLRADTSWRLPPATDLCPTCGASWSCEHWSPPAERAERAVLSVVDDRDTLRHRLRGDRRLGVVQRSDRLGYWPATCLRCGGEDGVAAYRGGPETVVLCALCDGELPADERDALMSGRWTQSIYAFAPGH